MTLRARRLTALLSFALVAVVAAGAVARRPLERALFVAIAGRATGLDVDAASVEAHDGIYDVAELRARDADGGLELTAPHARISVRKPFATLALDRPHLALSPESFGAGAAKRAESGLLRYLGNGSAVRVTARDGTVAVVDAGADARSVAALTALNGDVRADAAGPQFDLTTDLQDGAERYPIAARASTADDARVQTWTAAELPVAALAALFDPAAPAHGATGRLRDVTVTAGRSVHAEMRLDGVAFALESHALHGLHGNLVIDGGGAGSTGIAGTLDGGVPFDANGEVHDLGPCCAWLRAGSNDVQALARLAASLASEPKPSSVHVEATAPGIAFGQYGMVTAHGPLAVSVLAIDPREPTLRFDTAIAEDHVVSSGERTSAMGVRTKAVAGVNGDYFDIGRTYQPQGMLVRSGRLVRGPTDRAVLAIDAAKHVTFSEYRIAGTVETNEGTMQVTEFNDWPPGDVAVMTPDYATTVRPSSNATFVALAPVAGNGARYRVTAVAPPGTTPRGGFGIGIGPLVHVRPPRVGDVVRLSYRTTPPLDSVVAAIGGGPILLRDGAWYEDPHAPAPDERDVRWPVVALAREADDHLLLVAVDGRHPERSVGATRPEFAQILQRLGAVDAMALDSGGSVTLVSRKPGDANVSVRNVVSDFSAERWVSDALFLYSSAPLPTIVPVAAAPTPVPEARPTP